MSDIIIADADALIALFSKNDANHEKAKETLVSLINQNDNTYFPVTAISEAITASQRKLNDSVLAEVIMKKLIAGNLPLLPVDQEITILATTLFSPLGSKKNTFFDALIAAMARKYKAVAIFSFDVWYKKQGFILANDYVSI